MNENLINELKEKGIIKIENFLNINEIQDLTNIIKHYSAFKNTKNSFYNCNFYNSHSDYLLFTKPFSFDYVTVVFYLSLSV